jgi:predicted amidohydrolase
MLAEIASQHNCYIVYSTVWNEDEGRIRNCSQLLDRSGSVAGQYTKFYNTVAELGQGAIAGTELPVFECDFGRLSSIICYDMMFGELRAEVALTKPDVIAFSSVVSYGIESAVWAFECQSYLVESVWSTGGAIYSPLGDKIGNGTAHNDHVILDINLDRQVVQRYPRADYAGIRGKYGHKIKLEFPMASEVNSLLLTSETEEVTAAEVVAEFGAVTLESQMQRTRDGRAKALLNPPAG